MGKKRRDGVGKKRKQKLNASIDRHVGTEKIRGREGEKP